MLWRFMRNFRFRIKSFDAEKTFVGFDLSIFVNVQIAFFQDFEIVRCPARTSDGKNQPGQKADY